MLVDPEERLSQREVDLEKALVLDKIGKVVLFWLFFFSTPPLSLLGFSCYEFLVKDLHF